MFSVTRWARTRNACWKRHGYPTTRSVNHTLYYSFELISVYCQVRPGSDSVLPVCKAHHQVSGHPASLQACLSLLAVDLPLASAALLPGKPALHLLHQTQIDSRSLPVSSPLRSEHYRNFSCTSIVFCVFNELVETDTFNAGVGMKYSKKRNTNYNAIQTNVITTSH